MLGKVGEGMALAVGIAAGESILAELEAKVITKEFNMSCANFIGW